MAKINDLITISKGANYPIEVRIAALDSLSGAKDDSTAAQLITMTNNTTYSLDLRVAAVKAAGRFG